jgi:hypothetical protein
MLSQGVSDFAAVQLSVVAPGPEFDTESVWEPGFAPPAVPLKEILSLSRPIAGAKMVRVIWTVRGLLEALGSEMVIVPL